nr:zinc ribbon domain-containing protein [Bradyrhizobium yuanmingense]
MTVPHPIRKECPACGRPMKLVKSDAGPRRERYVCPVCDGDPLHDPTARKWVDSPLKPPSE